MTIAPTFEIRVALLGYVSVGKTTVLNALFRDKYSEVAMCRTTAGINCYRVWSSTKSGDNQGRGRDPEAFAKSNLVVAEPRTAASILKETIADNAALRESSTIQEKTFDIELDEPLCEMRKDTDLVVIDIPGINEAGASTKYKDYVSDNWHTFDCVVVVMDSRQGVNTEEQVDLLKLVEEYNRTKKNSPVIILCNKVDDPDDKEQQVLLREARSAVEKIFGVEDRAKALQGILENPPMTTDTTLSPAFIPISAVQAFIYQSSSRMDYDRFHEFDLDLLERLGREHFGKKWKHLSNEEKYTEAFSIVSDPEKCREGLADSNFDKFLAVLLCIVGGEGTQTCLLRKQVEVATSHILSLPAAKCIVKELQSIWERSKVLDLSVGSLSIPFWKHYSRCEEEAMVAFDHPSSVTALVHPMDQLTSYYELISRLECDDEQVSIIAAMKKLIRRQIAEVLRQDARWTFSGWETKKGSTFSGAQPFSGAQTSSTAQPSFSTAQPCSAAAFSTAQPFTTPSAFNTPQTFSARPTFSPFAATPSPSSVFGGQAFSRASSTSSKPEDPPASTTRPIFAASLVKRDADTNHPAQIDYTRLLSDFYMTYNPSRSENVAELLLRYKGREQEAFSRLAKKYNAPNPLELHKASAATYASQNSTCATSTSTNIPSFTCGVSSSTSPSMTIKLANTMTTNTSDTVLSWSALSPKDWSLIFGSILLMSADRNYYENFGREKMELEARLHWADRWSFLVYPCMYCKVGTRHNSGRCEKCMNTSDMTTYESKLKDIYRLNYSFGCLEPTHPEYKKLVSLDVPESLSDPKHFGHLLWKFCRFMDSISTCNHATSYSPANHSSEPSKSHVRESFPSSEVHLVEPSDMQKKETLPFVYPNYVPFAASLLLFMWIQSQIQAEHVMTLLLVAILCHNLALKSISLTSSSHEK